MATGHTSSGPRRRTPRGTLTPAVIVAAAIKIVQSAGPDGLTTNRLADDLGVRPMSLYTHFRDKGAILEAVAAELFSRFEMPRHNGSDIDFLRAMMRAYFRLLVDYPALVPLGVAVEGINPAEAQFTEAVYASLKQLGFPHREAVGSGATMMRFVIGCALIYPIRRVWDDDPDHWERIGREFAALPPERFPAMHELASNFPGFTQEEAFEYGLNMLLRAIADQARTHAETGQNQ